MAYDSPSTINASKGMGTIFEYLNNVTSWWFSNMLLLVIWVLVLVGFVKASRDDDFLGGLAVASYVTFILALIGWLANFVNGVTFSITIGASILSTIALLADKRGTA